MPIADNKKAQAIRNLWHMRVAGKVIEADTVVATIRAAITANGLADQFSGPELSAMQDVENALNSLAALSGVTAAASKYQASHGDHSLIIEGVND